MTFEGQYLTYQEYLQLGGTEIGETPFNLLEFEARKQIDLRTQNRLINLDEIPQEVKLCDYHLIDKITFYATSIQNANNGVANESIDGYSITYITATQIKDIIMTKDKELQDIIMSDLFGLKVNNEHVIYNGVK